MWQRSSVAWGVGLSLLLHGVWIGSLRSERPTKPARTATLLPYTAEFELTAEPTSRRTDRRDEVAPLPGGPESASALDLDQSEGAGGSGASTERVTLLFSFASEVALQDTELNNFEQNQTQRIQTSAARATQEERRATPHAAEAVFLASGEGQHRERRAPALRDPQPGVTGASGEPTLAARSARAGGTEAGSVDFNSTRTPQLARLEAARGILRGQGRRASESARVAHARPNVDQGPPATPAETLDAKIRDNHDAELLAAALQRSIVDASAQRAKVADVGHGGMASGPGLGFVGLGAGARALAYSPGPGLTPALDTRDARYVRWFVEQKERVQSELIFPRPRALAKDQGISIYQIVVRRDGRLARHPHLVRSSGFADFDEAAVVAIRRAVPFSPLPERLLPDADDVTLLIPVAFSNPMVQ